MHASVSRRVELGYSLPQRGARGFKHGRYSLLHAAVLLGSDEVQEFKRQLPLLDFCPQMRKESLNGNSSNGTMRLPVMPNLVRGVFGLMSVQAPTKSLAKQIRDYRICAGKSDFDVVVGRPMGVLLAYFFGASSDGDEPIGINRSSKVSIGCGRFHIPHCSNRGNAPLRLGKKWTGALLDGREWREFPRAAGAEVEEGDCAL